MSKKDENSDTAQPEAVRNSSAARSNGDDTFRAVEEHAAALGVSAPVFAAVKQANGWAAGKKVEKAVFEKAVKGFLNAPMGGK
jgi:hypothetical protein